jgi:deoxyribodipyrimidine photolyase-related protein
VRNKRAIALNNIEGFIRQIIGWREHCRLTYVIDYKNMAAANVLAGKIDVSKWGTTSKLEIAPLDDAIEKMTKYGYLHHIERLMIVGSFMLMMGANPDSAMKWFYHSSIDAFEWNMINNVKIMAMYAMGAKSYTTKPYIASSNYILKMSNYKRDGKWDVVWDALYWEFIRKNEAVIKHNPRMAMQIKFYKNKSKRQKILYNQVKQKFLKSFNHK